MKSLVIIPTLRERVNLETLIPAIFAVTSNTSVLIVDDNSADGTRELIIQLQLTHLGLYLLERKENPGYGKSMLDGLGWALDHGFQQVVTMDADFSHDPAIISELLSRLETHDVVIASRYIPGGGISDWSWYRRILSRFANTYVRVILGVPFHDGTTGFVAYRQHAVEIIVAHRPQSEGYAFLVETKYVLSESGARFMEYPLVFRDRFHGASKMSSKVIWESVLLPWRLKFRGKQRTM